MAEDLSAQAEALIPSEQYEAALRVLGRTQQTGLEARSVLACKVQRLLELDDYAGALAELEKGLAEVARETDADEQKRTYKQLASQKIQILKVAGSAAEYRTALEDVRTNPYSRKLRAWAESEAGGSDLSELQEKLADHPEYREFVRHYQGQTQEGDLWHIVSSQWTRRWLSHLQGEKEPGPISNTAVLDPASERVLIDPEPSKSYTNFRVKAGLTELEDFQVIPKPAYRFLVQKYGHDNTEVRRYSVATNVDGTSTVVEIWLKRVQVLLNLRLQEVSISRKETVADLKEKINRIAGEKGSSRLWKKKPTETTSALVDAVAKMRTAREPFPLREAVLLEDWKELEHADIADEDVVFVETLSESRRWLLVPEQVEVCTTCGRPGRLIACSACRAVKYCSADCQRKHQPLHKEECRRRQRKGRAGLVGLQNLGNTCFMNSAIQCLSHTEALTSFLLEEKYKADLNKKNPIGTGGRLVLAYVALLQSLWLDSASVQSPWELKRVISAFAPQFSGYQQHDSHELLSYLLDGMHEDLNRVRKKPYTSPSEEPGRSEEEVALDFWDNHLKRNQSVIVDLMHGQYKSTLVCPACSKVSVTFDPFLTYTLQIPNTETKKCCFFFIPCEVAAPVRELQCALSLTATISEVKAIISAEFGVSADTLLPVALEYKRFKGVAEDDMELSDLKQFELVFYEVQTSSLSLVYLNITEKTGSGSVRSASWPRLLFLQKEDTAEKIHCIVGELAEKLIGEEDASLRIVTRTRTKTSYFMFQSRAPCPFCSSKECQNCVLPKTPELTLATLQSKAEDRLEFELRCEGLFPRCDVRTQQHRSLKAAAGGKSRISLEDCLQYSSRPEVLSRDNAWFCGACKKEVQATKTLQMYKAPEVLIFHLKRFRPRYFEKLATVVDFSLVGLDLGEFILAPEHRAQVYDLYAVSNHFGSMLGGHYTAFVRSGERWFDMDVRLLEVPSPLRDGDRRSSASECRVRRAEIWQRLFSE